MLKELGVRNSEGDVRFELSSASYAFHFIIPDRFADPHLQQMADRYDIDMYSSYDEDTDAVTFGWSIIHHPEEPVGKRILD